MTDPTPAPPRDAPAPLRRRPLLLAGAAAAVAATGWLVWRGGGDATPMPAFDYVALDGTRGSSRDLRGRVALINFWATSCTTCVAEMPEIVRTHERFRARGYDTLAVAMSYDPPAYVANFAQSRKLPFTVALDASGELARRFGDVRMTPTTFLVDRRGRIVKRYLGRPDFAEVHALVERLLAAA